MRTIAEIKKEMEYVESEDKRLIEAFRDENDTTASWWDEYWKSGGSYWNRKKVALKNELKKEKNRQLNVGDGCTLYLFSDAYACTVIKRTNKTITIQRDKATLSPDFKPEWEVGGFAAHCTNSAEQEYTYERNENGEKYVCHWSEKEGRYRCGSDGSMKVGIGRNEYYDYNF